MRTNIDIDDATLDAAMRAGPYKTKKAAVDAGLKLLARQAAYREVLKWEGKLHWDGDSDAEEAVGAAAPAAAAGVRPGARAALRTVAVSEPPAPHRAAKASRGRR